MTYLPTSLDIMPFSQTISEGGANTVATSVPSRLGREGRRAADALTHSAGQLIVDFALLSVKAPNGT